MTKEQSVRTIIESCFSESKTENIDAAVKNIMSVVEEDCGEEMPTAIVMITASALYDAAEREAQAFGCRLIPERFEWEISGDLIEKCRPKTASGIYPCPDRVYFMGIPIRRTSKNGTLKLWKEIKA